MKVFYTTTKTLGSCLLILGKHCKIISQHEHKDFKGIEKEILFERNLFERNKFSYVKSLVFKNNFIIYVIRANTA